MVKPGQILAATMPLLVACVGQIGEPPGTPTARSEPEPGVIGDRSAGDDPDPWADPGSNPDPRSNPDPGTDPDPGTEPDPDPGTEPDPGAEPDPGTDPDPPVPGPDCPPDLQYFQEFVWEPLLAKDCVNCHSSQGLAQATRLVLSSEDEEGWLETNFETVRVLAEDTAQGGPLLLLKPTFQVPHGGAQRFTITSWQYEALSELVHRYANPGSCDAPGAGGSILCEPGAAPSPGPSPLRRLSSQQWARTVKDLLGEGIDVGSFVPETQSDGGYATYATANVVSQTDADAFFDAAEHIAAQAVQSPGALAACAAGGTVDAACAASFIDDFGLRAFRRPLTSEEKGLFQTLAAAAGTDDAATVLGMLLEAFLQSPQLLYLDMTGGVTVAEGIERLDDYAIASRLSYLLWNTLPDQALFDAAAAGELGDPTELEAQVLRMLEDPRARGAVDAFHGDWLHTYRLEGLKDGDLFPGFDPGAMREEVRRFVEHVVFDGAGSFEALMTSTTTFSNSTLDAIYGVDSGSSGPGDWQQVPLDGTRPGLLTRAGFLAGHAYEKTSSPILRGVWVIEQLFCQNLIPPDDIDTSLGEPVAGETIKDVIAAHRADPACASCHDRIDPIGFAFEHYDAVGAWRDAYPSGLPVEAEGALDNPAGEFDGAAELVELLVSSDVVKNCYATHWFRYANGRSDVGEDSCSLQQVHSRFADSGGDIQDLIVGIVLSDAFVYRVDEDLQQVEDAQ